MENRKRIKKFSWEYALIILVFVEMLFFGIINPNFLRVRNLLFTVNDFIYIGIAALPMTMVIITGGIDVSIGSVMGFASIILSYLWVHGVNIWIAVVMTLVAGLLLGFFMGILIVWTNIQPLIITLGGMFLYAGLAVVLSGQLGASGFEGVSGLPDSFSMLVNGFTLGLPNGVWLFIIFSVIFGVILHKTRFGKYLYLVGINANAAKYSGINVSLVKVAAYMLSGFGASISGIVLTSYFTSGRADLGNDALLPVITSVVLGGTNIMGGEGTILGTAIAVVFIGFMRYGLQQANIPSEQADVFIGMVLILAVGLRIWVGRAREKMLSHRAIKLQRINNG